METFANHGMRHILSSSLSSSSPLFRSPTSFIINSITQIWFSVRTTWKIVFIRMTTFWNLIVIESDTCIYLIQMLVVFKSAPILKRTLKVKHALLQLYVLKLLKMQTKYLGRQWRKSNMKTMSAIYQKVRHRLNDDWAYGNGEFFLFVFQTLFNYDVAYCIHCCSALIRNGLLFQFAE